MVQLKFLMKLPTVHSRLMANNSKSFMTTHQGQRRALNSSVLLSQWERRMNSSKLSWSSYHVVYLHSHWGQCWTQVWGRGFNFHLMFLCFLFKIRYFVFIMLGMFVSVLIEPRLVFIVALNENKGFFWAYVNNFDSPSLVRSFHTWLTCSCIVFSWILMRVRWRIRFDELYP